MSYEEKIKRLEEIVSLLESGEVGVEKSLELFKEGTMLAESSFKTLQEGKAKVLEIKKSLNEINEVPVVFDDDNK